MLSLLPTGAEATSDRELTIYLLHFRHLHNCTEVIISEFPMAVLSGLHIAVRIDHAAKDYLIRSRGSTDELCQRIGLVE